MQVLICVYTQILSTGLLLCDQEMDYASMQMDWGRIRQEIRAVRKEHKITLRILHQKTGVSPSTVNRIERVEKYPAHKPDLETIQTLVSAMDLTLSQFFARIEGLQTHDVSETLPTPAPNPRGNHGSSNPVRRISLDDTNAIIARNTAALDELIEAVRMVGGELRATREQNANARAPQPAKDARRRKVG
jgi:DNA-binding XRE family transcriptional regulator